jgi:MFS family permease
MTMAQAGALVSLALWVGMLSIPLGGFAAQKTGRPNLTIVAFCLMAALCLAALAGGAPAALACIGIGLAIGPPPGIITALPTRILPAPQRAGGFGVFYTFHYLFQSTGPAIAGRLHDAAGAQAAVLFAAGLFLAPLPLLAAFEFLARRMAAALPPVAAIR